MIFYTSRKYVHCRIKVNLKMKTQIRVNMKRVKLPGVKTLSDFIKNFH